MSAAARVERYYDSRDADVFYEEIWGGEDIHIGLYRPGDDIRAASRRTVEAMAERVGAALRPGAHVVDLGAGYGGSARYLAGRYGCPVTCVNLSEVQNQRNRERCAAAGVTGIKVLHADFAALPLADAQFAVAWSQDAFLHAADRGRVIAEAARVLLPGGHLVFTDPMRDERALPAELGPILERLELTDLATITSHLEAAAAAGLELVLVDDRSTALAQHYEAVREALATRRRELATRISAAYLERMLRGLSLWVDGGRRGLLRWGIFVFRKPRR